MNSIVIHVQADVIFVLSQARLYGEDHISKLSLTV